ncbi:MAG TPA: flagellar export chaperone FliS [Candidatus Binatia bacterium]|jgi:flagellar protein FliS
MNLAYQPQVNAYKRNEVLTADRGTVLLMLYQGAIDFLKKAKERMGEGDMAGKGTYISKTHAIISEFISSLNHEIGGELSRTLEDLYKFMLDQLMQAHVGNESKPLDDVIALLETLKEGWQGAVVQAREQGVL